VAALVQQELTQQGQMAGTAPSTLKLLQAVAAAALVLERVVQGVLAVVVVVLALVIQAAQVCLGRATMAEKAAMLPLAVATITQAVVAAAQVRLALLV